MRCAFIGQKSSLSEKVLEQIEVAGTGHVECLSTEEVFVLVERGQADIGIIPIESLKEGSVNSTLDSLVYGHHQLEIQQEIVVSTRGEDQTPDQIRYIVVGHGICEPTGRDKTSLALFMKADRPGALFMILSEFNYGEINLTKIQSRPTKHQLGDYMFFIDIEGHVTDPTVMTALNCLRLKLREVKVLGSYPLTHIGGNGGI